MFIMGDTGVRRTDVVVRRNTVDAPSHDSGCISAEPTDSWKAEHTAALYGNTHRRHHSEPACFSSLSQLFSGSEETLEPLLHDTLDDVAIGKSWDEAKRFLIESRMRDLEISRDMERENMHLYLSEMLIAAMEQMHWRALVDYQQNSTAQPRNTSSCPTLATSSELHSSDSSELLAKQRHSGSSVFYASADDLHFGQDEEIPANDSEANDDSGCESSAEAVASSLLRHFSTAYKPRSAADIQWLVSYAQAPQTLLPVPDDIAVFMEELGRNGRPIFFRGSNSWAPPRKQWIFQLHPPLKSVQKFLEQQQYRCGGCGIKVAKVYTRRMRYCDYYGKLFCQRCHQGAKSRIPARIIYQWNFKEYPVSDIAHRFLLDNHHQPVINASAVDSRFYDKIRRLKKIRQLRIKLVHIWSYIRLCSIAEETITRHGNLYAIFSTVPNYMLSDADVYSMEDLENVQKGELHRIISPIVQYGQYHVEGCEHCRAQAFVCELCDERDDLLFPFQIERVDRCEDCGSLSHQKCAAKRRQSGKPCPKCVRIQQNLERHRRHSESSLVPLTENSTTSAVID